MDAVDSTTPLGATAICGGVTFRLWAPSARAVFVVTDAAELAQMATAGWRPAAADALPALGDGTWGGRVPGIGVNASYMFWVDGQGSSGPKRDPYARELTLLPAFPDCHCLVRDPADYPWHDAGWAAPQFRDLVIYQLHIGTWWAQDAAGDDVRATRGGTFLDVVGKLTHLRDLGVNAVQFLPVQNFESQYSMGYNGVDLFSPEGEYQLPPSPELDARIAQVNAMLRGFGKGDIAPAQLVSGANQLRCLVDLCHLHGIAVILDLVYNHAGGNFDPNSLWFLDRQENGDLNHSLYFTDQGFAGGQVFAYWNRWVQQFLIDNACMFLREYHIDGMRYDEVRIIADSGGRDLCRDLTATVRYVGASAIQIAEYWDADRANAVLPPPGGLGFDAELGDGLRDALRGLLGAASGGQGAALDLGAVAAVMGRPGGFPDAWRVVQSIENQDITYADHSGAARAPMLADPADRGSWYARSRCRAVMGLLFAAPGIPALFMGQEMLEDKNWSDSRDRADTFVWWAGLAQDAARRDFLRFMTDLIHCRATHQALRGESIRVSRADSYDRVMVVHRWLDGTGQDVIVVVSLDEHAKQGYSIGLPFAGWWQEVLNSDYYDNFPNGGVIGNGGGIEAHAGPLDGFLYSALLTIPPNSVLVLMPQRMK